MKNFTGTSSPYEPYEPYEPPERPDLRLDTSTESPERCVERVLESLG